MSEVCVISIYVPEIGKTKDFYTNVLGFKVNKEYGPKILTLVHGELPIVLEESDKAETRVNSNPSGVVLALSTEDIQQTARRLKEHNVEFIVEEPTPCPPGKFISFRDPFGNVLEYLQFD